MMEMEADSQLALKVWNLIIPFTDMAMYKVQGRGVLVLLPVRYMCGLVVGRRRIRSKS